MQNSYATKGFKIGSSFSLLLKKFLSKRCAPSLESNISNCNFRNYWNSTNQNKITASTYFDYYTTYIYYNFPIIIIIIIITIYISLINCLYFNFCYSCCFRLERNETLVKKSINSIIASLLFFVGISIFTLYRIYSLKQSFDEIMCDVVSTTVFMPLIGSNVTNAVKRSTIGDDWTGLMTLNSTTSSIRQTITDLERTYQNESTEIENDKNLSNLFNSTIYGLNFFKEEYIGKDNTNHRLLLEETDIELTFSYKNREKLNDTLQLVEEEFNQNISIFEKNITKIIKMLNEFFNSGNSDAQMFELDLNLRIEIFKALKFYNTVDSMFHEYITYYNTANILQYIFCISNGVCSFFCFFFFMVFS